MPEDKPIWTREGSLLDRWLKRRPAEAATSELPRRPPDERAVLSPGQYRLWVLQRLFPGNPFYHYAERYELQGALDVDRFFEAFEAVAWVQQQLRTTFPLDEAGHPYPLLHPQPLVQRRLLDWSDRDGEDLSAELEALLQEEARRPFDLEKGPLTRLLLVARPEQGWTLLVTCHHIIVDKWSMRILRGEWARAYQALLNGTPPNPNPPPVQYEDFAWWERHQPPPPEHLQFWKLKLEDLPEALPLPTDRPRPPRPSFNGAFLERPLPPALAEALKGLARNAETTLFTLLLTAFKVLLFRYSGQRDLCVGTPLSNRNRSELEHLIGFFNETILLRTRLDPESSFRAFLHRVHRETQEAFRHHQVPFETLVRTLKPERALSANPFFQVMCLYHRVEEEAPFAPELRMRVAPFDLGVAKFDLTLYLSDAPDELRLIVEYATDLFEAATVERMLDHLVRLLEAAVRSPDTPLRALPLLNPEERRRILVEWNATAQPPPDASTVLELIERQAAERPEHPAVISEDGGLSYGELAARSSALAALLRAEGVGQGAVVGLCCRRSPEMLVGLLGILKAGGAYLPLDPAYPPDRLRFMLDDGGARHLVLQRGLEPELPRQALQVFHPPEAGEANFPPLPPPQPEDLAYLIYTSGSTGRPKGVCVSHRNLLASTAARFAFYAESPARFLLLSSLSFDSSVAGLFWTLSTGGTLLLPPERAEQDLQELGGRIARWQATHTLLLPSLYGLLLRQARPQDLSSLRCVIVAGEACPPAVCARHFETLPRTALFNEYGPTEATVWCVACRLQPDDARGRVPIGRPVPHARAYVLDEWGEPLPPGVPGELFIGGEGLSPGYHRHPEWTRERFPLLEWTLPDGQTLRERLYRTGDRARYRPDGTLEFLGRADEQVKLRGFRIELEEVRRHLLEHPRVQDAAVLLHRPAPPPPDPETLTQALSQLPPAEAERLLQLVESASEPTNPNP